MTLESPLPLPELPLSGAPPDAIVEIAPIPEDGPADLPRIGPLARADRNNLWLSVPGVARFWVRDGNRIVVDPKPGADEASIRTFLLASPLAALLFQRDRLVMHGSAVAIDGQALLILGASGSGKSTLAATLMQRGHPVLSDDVIALDGQNRVLPGIPRLKLWRDTFKRLGLPRENLPFIRPGIERYHLPTPPAPAPLPVRWVVILAFHNFDDTMIEPLRGMNRFIPLRKQTYRVAFMDHMGLKPRHMTQVAALSARAGVWFLGFSHHSTPPAALADRLLALVGEANP